MTKNKNKDFQGMEDQQGSQGEEKVKLVKAKLSDAAYDYQRDTERMLEASEASRPSYELPDTDVDKKGRRKRSIQGSKKDAEKNSGGPANPKVFKDNEERASD